MIDITKIKNELKSYMVRKGISMRQLAKLMAEKYNRPTITVGNLSNKLTKGTIRYTEALEIAETLGYKIVWEEV